METFVVRRKLDLGFEQRAEPKLANSRDVKIRVRATGICGSDVHYWQHGGIGKFILEQPMVLGHESAGEVVEVGKDVEDLKIGDCVAMEPGVQCRHCHYCKTGFYNLCSEMKFAATPPVDGTLAKYYILPSDFCYKLPPSMSLEEGALMEPLSVAVHVVKQANVHIGDSIVVFGAGPVGLLCCAVAKAYGASKIIAVDIVQSRLDLAVSYAATHQHKAERGDTPATNAQKIIEKFLLKEGADRAIDASGAPSSIASAIHVLRPGGSYVQAGDYMQSLELISSARVSVKELITHRFSFKEAEKAFSIVHKGEDGVIKAIISGIE